MSLHDSTPLPGFSGTSAPEPCNVHAASLLATLAHTGQTLRVGSDIEVPRPHPGLGPRKPTPTERIFTLNLTPTALVLPWPPISPRHLAGGTVLLPLTPSGAGATATPREAHSLRRPFPAICSQPWALLHTHDEGRREGRVASPCPPHLCPALAAGSGSGCLPASPRRERSCGRLSSFDPVRQLPREMGIRMGVGGVHLEVNGNAPQARMPPSPTAGA